jgi:prepilin peptidase CpaA
VKAKGVKTMSTSLLLIRAALWSASLILLAMAALQDMRARIIPNRLVLTIAAAGLLLGAVTRPSSLWISLPVAFVLFLGLGVLSHYDYLGAGDAKLIATVTLLAPPDRVAALLLAIALAGSLLGLIYLALHHSLKRMRSPDGSHRTARATSGFGRWLRNERARIIGGQSMPYGVAIVAGTAGYFASELHQCLSAIYCSL